MRYFVKAVITGFGLSVGKMLYEKVSQKLGEKKPEKNGDEPEPIIPDADNDDPVVAETA